MSLAAIYRVIVFQRIIQGRRAGKRSASRLRHYSISINVGQVLPAIQNSIPPSETHARRLCHPLIIFKLSRFFLSLLALILFTPLLGLFAAEFPDDAAGAEFAIKAGVGAGLAEVQALLAIAQFMLLAPHARVPVRVKAAFLHRLIIAKRATPPKAEVIHSGSGEPLSVATRLCRFPIFKSPSIPPCQRVTFAVIPYSSPL